MAKRTTGRGATRRRRERVAVTRVDSVQALLSNVTSLVTENKALADENARLKQVLERIANMLGRASEAGLALIEARPTPATTDGRRRRRGRPAVRRRAPVTNPESLERRRAALARAREVLAAKRAAARQASV